VGLVKFPARVAVYLGLVDFSTRVVINFGIGSISCTFCYILCVWLIVLHVLLYIEGLVLLLAHVAIYLDLVDFTALVFIHSGLVECPLHVVILCGLG
jgi:hypothetical protein